MSSSKQFRKAAVVYCTQENYLLLHNNDVDDRGEREMITKKVCFKAVPTDASINSANFRFIILLTVYRCAVSTKKSAKQRRRKNKNSKITFRISLR
jgi:hypothetical protein